MATQQGSNVTLDPIVVNKNPNILQQLLYAVGQSGANFGGQVLQGGMLSKDTADSLTQGTMQNFNALIQGATGQKLDPMQVEAAVKEKKKRIEERTTTLPDEHVEQIIQGGQESTPSVSTPLDTSGESAQNQEFVRNKNPFGFGGPDSEGNVRDTGDVMKILQLLAGGGINNPAETAKASQEMKGQTPLQAGEKEKLLAGAAFETPKLTNESIVALGTAFDKTYQTLSATEKAGMLLGNVPQRLKVISDQLQSASKQQGKAFIGREKQIRKMSGEGVKKTISGFKILKVHGDK
jgi:hypothetical protein